MNKQPMQPLYFDNDQPRFQPNAIVRYLFNWASKRGMNLDELSSMPFTEADWEQFYQLLGYSLCGFIETGASLESVEKATQIVEFLSSEDRLQKILGDMDIPVNRRELTSYNLKWLARNIGLQNSNHPDLQEAITLIKKLLRRNK
jgi:hypothetical protein